jgi:hypothetical protein
VPIRHRLVTHVARLVIAHLADSGKLAVRMAIDEDPGRPSDLATIRGGVEPWSRTPKAATLRGLGCPCARRMADEYQRIGAGYGQDAFTSAFRTSSS